MVYRSSLILNMVGGMDGDDDTFLNSKTCRKVRRLSAMRRVAGTTPLTARLVHNRYNLMYIGSSRSEEGWKNFCFSIFNHVDTELYEL